jgi:hypothetical protein
VSGPLPEITPVSQVVPVSQVAAAQTGMVANTMTVRERSGATQTRYPLQFARPFMPGEIPDVPQVLVNGAPIPTQADVKQRYPDGSVRHAVIAVVIPTIPAHGAVTLSFRNERAGNNTPLTTAEMLDAKYGFEAEIHIAGGGQSRTASARTMLQNGDYTLWTQGPIAQTIILADHSTARRYDMGFDALRSVRPIFHATFWPSLNQVKIRYIGENINTETLQDVAYALALTRGTGKTSIYTHGNVPHYAATRWTRTGWTGNAPEQKINIDHNLGYLGQTRFFPNYDASIAVPEATLARLHEEWLARPRDLYEAGNWVPYMPTTGGRDEIGPYPGVTVIWLYSGDWRAAEVILAQADLAAAWPLQVREGNPRKTFDRAGAVPALGKPVSINARPTEWLFDDRGRPAPEDKVTIQGPRIKTSTYPDTNGGWDPDSAHQPDPYSAPYTLTGDPWHLEQMQMWAASQALKYCVGAEWCRAPHGKGQYAGIFDQIRGNAWVFRNRTHAAFLSPDRTDEKTYFRTLSDDAIALWEGHYGLTGTSFDAHPLKQWARSHFVPQSPLHYLGAGSDLSGDDPAFTQPVTQAAMWQAAFFMTEIGRAAERGFKVDALKAYVGKLFTQQFVSPGYDPHLSAAYQHPVQDANGRFIPTWRDVHNTFSATERENLVNAWGEYVDDYPALIYGASTFLTDQPDGPQAYAWLRGKKYEPFRSQFAAYPKWALLPRTLNDAPGSRP